MPIRYYSSIAVDTTISTPILAGTTTVSVSSTAGWPLTYPFSLALDYGGALEEIVDVTSLSGLTATITRGVDSTTAVAHGVGAIVRHVITARDIRDSNTHINTTSGAGAHGILDVQGYTTTVTAAGTTTLTSTSTALQFFTGTTTQTVVLPVTSTLALGQKFRVVNNSTGSITVQSSGLNTIATVTAGVTMDFYCILITGTTAASWNNNVGGVGTVTGTGTLVLATSPTLTTPALGVATATSINGATVPSVADTLVGKATTDVLTNKDLTSGTNTFPATLVTTTGNQNQTDPKINQAINAQTGTTYTPVLTDNNKVVTLNNASAISVTIPTNASVAFPLGARIDFIWVTGAGAPTISAVTPGTTTIASRGATSASPKLNAVNSACTAIKIATDAWQVIGEVV